MTGLVQVSNATGIVQVSNATGIQYLKIIMPPNALDYFNTKEHTKLNKIIPHFVNQ